MAATTRSTRHTKMAENGDPNEQQQEVEQAMEENWKTRMEKLFTDVAALTENFKGIGSLQQLSDSFRDTEKLAQKTAQDLTLLEGKSITIEGTLKTHSKTLFKDHRYHSEFIALPSGNLIQWLDLRRK